MEGLGDRGLLKETENTLPEWDRSTQLWIKSRCQLTILSIKEGQSCPFNLLRTFVPSFVP